MTEHNPFAGMDREEMDDAKKKIVSAIHGVEYITKFLASDVGKQLIADKKRDLAEVLNRYGKLATKSNAEEIVRELVRLQVFEEILRKEVEKYEDVEKKKKKLDNDLKLWYYSIKELEKADSLGR